MKIFKICFIWIVFGLSQIFGQTPFLIGKTYHYYTPVTKTHDYSDDYLQLNATKLSFGTIDRSIGSSGLGTMRILYGINTITDSINGLTKVINNPTKDVTYHNQASISYTTVNGVNVYKAGIDSSFVIPLREPILNTVTEGDLSLTLTLTNNNESQADSMVLQRDTINGSSWVDIKWLAKTASTYKDSGSLFYNGEYKYRLANYKNNRYYSSTITGTVINPNPPLTFNYNPFVVSMDSTPEIAGAPAKTYDRTLVAMDFEDGDTSDIGTVTLAGTGSALSSGTAYKYINTRGIKIQLGTTDPNVYGLKTFTEQDTLWGAFYVRFDASINTSNIEVIAICVISGVPNASDKVKLQTYFARYRDK